MCWGEIVHGMQVNDMAYGYLHFGKDIELAESETVTSIRYNIMTEGYYRGGVCGLVIVTNQNTHGPFGTIKCSDKWWGTGAVHSRSQNVPDGMTFPEFFKSIAGLTEQLFGSTSEPFLAFEDVFVTPGKNLAPGLIYIRHLKRLFSPVLCFDQVK